MADVVVSAPVLWTKHVHGDPGLIARLQSLRAGETVELAVAGVRGTWRKMEDGRDGRPTPGLRPIGSAEAFWRRLRELSKGEVVPITPVEGPERRGGRLERREADRIAAGEAFLAASGRPSDGQRLTPDEMNERW